MSKLTTAQKNWLAQLTLRNIAKFTVFTEEVYEAMDDFEVDENIEVTEDDVKDIANRAKVIMSKATIPPEILRGEVNG